MIYYYWNMTRSGTYLDIMQAKGLQNLLFFCLCLSTRCALNDWAHRLRCTRLKTSSHIVQFIFVDQAFRTRIVCMARCSTRTKTIGLLPILWLNYYTWMQDTSFSISTSHCLTTLWASPKRGKYSARNFVIYLSLEMSKLECLLCSSIIGVTWIWNLVMIID